MPFLRWILLAGCAAFMLACERGGNVPPVDTTRTVGTDTAQTPPVPAGADWDASLGTALLVGGEAAQTAGLITPLPSGDTLSGLHGTQVVLLGRSGSLQRATLDSIGEPGEDACAGVVAWQLASGTDGGIAPWAIGFAGTQRVQPLAMDSLEAMTGADSTALVAQVARLASTATMAESRRFSGLPYTVQSLWRFRLSDGARVVAATLIRRLNVEAEPLEERTLLIAERDSGSSAYHLAYQQRSQGNEETVESHEFVAALTFAATDRPVLVIAHDYESAVAYSFAERVAPGKWQIRWTSRRIDCRD